eukprot:739877-Hanusia_phi.AAC.7
MFSSSQALVLAMCFGSSLAARCCVVPNFLNENVAPGLVQCQQECSAFVQYTTTQSCILNRTCEYAMTDFNSAMNLAVQVTIALRSRAAHDKTGLFCRGCLRVRFARPTSGFAFLESCALEESAMPLRTPCPFLANSLCAGRWGLGVLCCWSDLKPQICAYHFPRCITDYLIFSYEVCSAICAWSYPARSQTARTPQVCQMTCDDVSIYCNITLDEVRSPSPLSHFLLSFTPPPPLLLLPPPLLSFPVLHFLIAFLFLLPDCRHSKMHQ